MSLLRQLGYFSLRMLKETVLCILLALDLVGFLLTYFTSLSLPSWLFGLIPVVAIFLASFNIYRQGTADARIVFLDQDNVEYDCVSSAGDPEYLFNSPFA